MTSSNNFVMSNDYRYLRHTKLIQKYLPYIEDYGYYGLYSFTLHEVKINEERMKDTILNPSKKYSEIVNLSKRTDSHQYGYTKSYEAERTQRNNNTSQLVTCYIDGCVVSDGYLDVFMETNNGFNPHWFMYEVQRHLELTKEVLSGLIDEILCIVTFKGIEKFEWELYRIHHISGKMPYAGYPEDIVRNIKLDEIHGRDNWNIKMGIVEDILLEVARIFGLDRLPQKYWDEKTGEILYAKGFSMR